MKKQLLLVLLALMPMVPILASVEQVQIDGLWYNIVSKAKVADLITLRTGSYSGDIIIPESITYDGVVYRVGSISGAFKDCKSLTSVTIPNSVTTIGDNAFDGCTGLTSITIPNSVTSIGEYAFSSCSGLTSFPILNSVSSIGNNAFCHCSGLNTFTIGDCVTNIGSQAFYNCSNLTSISFGNSIINFGSSVFKYCTSLNSVYINNLSSWCSNTFSDSFSNPLYYAHHLFINGDEVTDLIIPNDVTTINASLFYGCSYLNSVTIGNSVKNIGSSAFAKCENIADVFCYSDAVPTTDKDAFLNSYIQYATLHVPADLVEAYRSTAPWNSIINIVPIEGEIPKVNKCATPTIEYSNGSVTCNCETEGVKYVYQIAPVTVKQESESGRFAFAPTYEITVYATREGYKDSDTASIIVGLSNVGDLNGDGQVSIADVTFLVNLILGKNTQ